jgi:PIN domain nuclease of toxin-antitoxin system
LEGANEIVGVSLISCLEVSYLVKGRRLELTIPLPDWFDAALSDSGIELIIPAPTILYMATTLPDIHKDPADRIIIATALDLKATLVTADETIRKYPGLVWVWDQIPEK